jgi:hypothetical protein
MDFLDALVVGVVVFLSWVLPKLELIRSRVVLEVLKQSALYPWCDKCKELQATPRLRLIDIKPNMSESDVNDMLATIFEDMELAILGVNYDVKLIVACIFANRTTFFLRELDYIVISDMGFVSLVLEMARPEADSASKKSNNTAPGTRRSRSLFIEITAFRSAWLSASLNLSGVLFGLGMVATKAVDWRALAVVAYNTAMMK